jgi:hypothetical protein
MELVLLHFRQYSLVSERKQLDQRLAKIQILASFDSKQLKWKKIHTYRSHDLRQPCAKLVKAGTVIQTTLGHIRAQCTPLPRKTSTMNQREYLSGSMSIIRRRSYFFLKIEICK